MKTKPSPRFQVNSRAALVKVSTLPAWLGGFWLWGVELWASDSRQMEYFSDCYGLVNPSFCTETVILFALTQYLWCCLSHKPLQSKRSTYPCMESVFPKQYDMFFWFLFTFINPTVLFSFGSVHVLLDDETAQKKLWFKIVFCPALWYFYATN